MSKKKCEVCGKEIGPYYITEQAEEGDKHYHTGCFLMQDEKEKHFEKIEYNYKKEE